MHKKTFGPYGRSQKIPRNLEDITAPWLTSVLVNRYPGIVVEGMKTIEVRNGHTTKIRLELDFNDVGKASGIPRQVCIKANWSEGFESGDICELEARFYYYIRENLSIPAPNCFYADWDDDGSGQGMVVMEDLATEGGVFGHSTHHIGVDAVAHALEGLAQLHGAWWGSDKLDQYQWLQTSMATTVDCEQQRQLWPFAKLNIDKTDYQKILPQWLLDNPQRLETAYDKLVAYAQAQTGPLCVVHGDSHLGNSYLRPSGERLWIDWQLVRKGHPWRDLTYFMLGTLTIDERRTEEDKLLKHYYEVLLSTGATDLMSLDKVREQYHRWPIYGMQAWLANQDEWGQHGLPMVERFYQAAEDFGTLKLIESL
ncbi:MAG: phosphotransferase [Spongiibacteraceae bacterium]